jgi:hypothetical protein
MSLSKIIFCIFCFFFSTLVSVGQRKPAKYGKVEEKEIALTSYHGADAVILSDYGEYKFDGITGHLYFYFTHHVRIKILTEAGLRFATQKIQYYDLRSAMYSSGNETNTLRAQTLNVNEKGKVITSKVKPKFTVTAPPDENYNASVTIYFPDVKPGSIIEYEITIPTIETVNPEPWMVQYDIPCLWNELRIITPLEFNYAIKPYNIDYSEVSEFTNITTSIKYPGKSVVYNANFFQFVRKDIPALPFPGNELDYNNSRMFVKFMLDFASKKFELPKMNEIIKAMDPEYKFMDKSEKQLTLSNPSYILYKRPDLSKIAKYLNKNQQFGVPLVLNMGFDDTIKKLTALYNTDKEKVEAVYLFVRNLVEWNNQYRIFVAAPVPQFIVKVANKFAKEPVKMNTGLQKVAQKHEGNSSDINAILINLLKKAGFKTYPVLVSTLNKCYLDTAFFNLHQFNHVIAAVELNGQEILLDAVTKGNGSIMSSDIMNEYGLLIEMRGARWIQVAYPYAVLPRSMELPSFEQTEQ